MVELWAKSVISFSNAYVLMYLAWLAAFTEMIDGGNDRSPRHGDRRRLYLIDSK
jgi:hypothetical protein